MPNNKLIKGLLGLPNMKAAAGMNLRGKAIYNASTHTPNPGGTTINKGALLRRIRKS